MQEQAVTYVKQLRPPRRLELGEKARRCLALGLATPALLFLLASAREWLTHSWPAHLESLEEILPVLRAAVALFLGGFAYKVWRDRSAEKALPRRWFLEPDEFPGDRPVDPVRPDAEKSEPAA